MADAENISVADKSQFTTVAPAAHYGNFAWVLARSTFGVPIANGPVVYFSERLLRSAPLRTVHLISEAAFVVIGVVALI